MSAAGQISWDDEAKTSDPEIKWDTPQETAPSATAQPVAWRATIQAPQRSTWQRLGAPVVHAAVNEQFPYLHPFNAVQRASESLGETIAPLENYTQAGRVEHPMLSRLGDVTAGTKRLAGIVGPELAAIGPGGLAETGARAGEVLSGGLPAVGKFAAETLRNPMTGGVRPIRVLGTNIPEGILERTIPKMNPEDVFANKVARGVEAAKVRQAVKDATAGAAKISRAGGEGGTASPVAVVPEPNPLAEGQRPGAMWSVKRSELGPAASRGVEGAIPVLQSQGRPLIITPRGAGISNVRERVGLPNVGDVNLEELRDVLRTIPQRFLGPEENVASMPQGGHAGGNVASAEEVSRAGKNYVVKPSGTSTYHGKAFAPEGIRQGEAHVTLFPDGSIRTNAGFLSPQMERNFRRNLE